MKTPNEKINRIQAANLKAIEAKEVYDIQKKKVEEQLKAMTEDRNLLWECYNSVIEERNKYKDALETIANEEGSSCQRCEGNGSLWADGKAHLPSYVGATVRCGNCGGEGRIYEDVKQIAIDVLY